MIQDTLRTLTHEHFAELDDPHVERTRPHHLLDIVTIALLAVLSGAEGWVAMETYGKAKPEWLSRFLESPNGIPSHATFACVLARIDPQPLEQRFQSWIERLVFDDNDHGRLTSNRL